VYGADLLNGSGALSSAGGSSTAGVGTTDSAGNAGSNPAANAGAGGMSPSQAGDGAIGDGDAGQGAVSAGGGNSAAGSGGKSGSGGSAGFANSAGGPAVDPNLIDDFEDNDKLIAFVNSPRRDGIWDTNNDMTVGAVQTPVPMSFKPSLLGADAPYAGDMYAAHSTGKGFTTYAYMNVSMRAVADYALTPVYDASAYKGVSFLAKVSAASYKAMRVRFVSGDTDPRLKKCTVGAATATACYNHYYDPVTLTTTWAQYTIDFASFIQGGDGQLNPTIDLKEMFGLEFYFNGANDYDLWLDDLRFTK
jgi:hypothetical protein